jgi:hypothetical protein
MFTQTQPTSITINPNKIDTNIENPTISTNVQENSNQFATNIQPNPYLEQCHTFEDTVQAFNEVYRIKYNPTNCRLENTINLWCLEIRTRLYDFINKDMKPTFDEIDSMLEICNTLLSYELEFYEEFIFKCPEKFLLTYSNNSERTPMLLEELYQLDLLNVRSYLIQYVHETKLKIWDSRNALKN